MSNDTKPRIGVRELENHLGLNDLPLKTRYDELMNQLKKDFEHMPHGTLKASSDFDSSVFMMFNKLRQHREVIVNDNMRSERVTGLTRKRYIVGPLLNEPPIN